MSDSSENDPVLAEGSLIARGGLNQAEIGERVQRGERNGSDATSTRSVSSIVARNVFTRFNAILGLLTVIIAVIGPIQDGVFAIVVCANTIIGVVQELRAKRTLDAMRVLTAPTATVTRAGTTVIIDPADLVIDDLMSLAAGDQVSADANVIDGVLEMDESTITGESEPVVRQAGDEILSGSVVMAGEARCQVVKVGVEGFARALTVSGRRPRPPTSELMAGINQVLRVVGWLMVPVGALLVASQLRLLPTREALRGSVAGIGSMVPEGLVLLTSAALAAAIVRLSRRRVVVQQLSAVEGLARADVVCMDKTGTLTDRELRIERLVVVDRSASVEEALGALAGTEERPNASLAAIGDRYPEPTGWKLSERVPFSSARRWAASTFEAQGTWVLGAPEVLTSDAALTKQAAQMSKSGRRVLVVGRATSPPGRHEAPAMTPVALVVLEEQVRPHAAATLAFLTAQGVSVKLLSGDDPSTVNTLAERVGMARHGAVDGRSLPSRNELDALVDARDVFGRMAPQDKVEVVAALQRQGHRVAMIGDGVNDVPALKQANTGIAMGSGTPAARAAADLVLLDDEFGVIPDVIHEGRRVLANVERAASLFITKTVYAAVLAVLVGLTGVSYPFLPRQLTVISALTIGIPGLVLALSARADRWRAGYLRRVVQVSGPAGLVAAVAVYAAHRLASGSAGHAAAATVLFVVGLWVVSLVARPLTIGRLGLLAVLAGAYAATLAVPSIAAFTALGSGGASLGWSTVVIAAGSVVVLEGLARLRQHHARSPTRPRRNVVTRASRVSV